MREMLIYVQQHLNMDGFDVIINENKNEIFKKEYFYGCNASWNKRYSSEKEPWANDIIKELKNKYKPEVIKILQGKNIFKGDLVTAEDVKKFEKEHIED